MFQSSLDALGNNRPVGLVSPAGSNRPVAVKGNDKVETVLPEPTINEKQQLEGAVKKLNDYVAPALQTIQFSIDQESERIIVKVVDTTTQEVLRQIPNEEVLAITKTLDKLQGLVIRQTA